MGDHKAILPFISVLFLQNAKVLETCQPLDALDQRSYMIVSGCPPSANRTITDQCKSLHSDVQKTPVTDLHSGVTYRNIFCAQCHDQFHKVTRWQLRVTCSQESNNGYLLRKPGTVQLKPCHVPKRRHFGSLQKRATETRTAISLGYTTLLNFGVDGRPHRLLTNDEHDYLQRTDCKENQILNPFNDNECMRIDCPNHHVITLAGDCVEKQNLKAPPLDHNQICLELKIRYRLKEEMKSIISDRTFKETLTTHIVQNFNLSKDNILLPDNILSNNSHCQRDSNNGSTEWNTSYAMSVTEKHVEAYRMTLSIPSEAQATFSCGNLTDDLHSEYAGEITTSMTFRSKNLTSLVKLTGTIESLCIKNIPLSVFYQTNEENDSHVAGSACIISVRSYKQKNDWCYGFKSVYQNDEFELITSEKGLIQGVRVKGTNKEYAPSEFQFYGVADKGTFWGDIRQFVFVCDTFPQIKSDGSCPRLKFQPEDYVSLPNGSIRVTYLEDLYSNAPAPSMMMAPSTQIKTVYNSDEYEYAWPDFIQGFSFENASVHICVPEQIIALFVEGSVWSKVKISGSCEELASFGYVSSIAGVVFSGISFIAMIVILITYSLFRSLRKLPGICLMNLTVAIMLSQVAFLVGTYYDFGTNDNNFGCFTLAIMTHYFILSSFLWMNVMAYSSYRSFGANLKTQINQYNKRHLIFYVAYGWGIPGIIVIACALIDYFTRAQKLIAYGLVTAVKVQHTKDANGNIENIELIYRTVESCWIGNRTAAMLVFGVPLIYSMVTNLALFIKTCIGK